MNVKKYLRFLMLLSFLCIASIVPFPINYTRKDKLPAYKIEQVDKNEDEDHEEDKHQAFS